MAIATPIESPAPPERSSWGWRRGVELAASLAIIAASMPYLAKALHAAATHSLWTDEIYSVVHYSGKGPWTTITNYDVANNHVFFNLLGSLTPGAGSFDPLHARIWSIVAVLAMLVLAVYEFFRREWYLAGGLFVFVICVNHNGLDLALQARGYGILYFCGVAISLWAWRYVQTGRRRWLIGLALATVAGTWSVPTFVLFAGPVWLGLLAEDRTWKLFRYGAATLAAILVVYLPIQAQLRHQFSTYASIYGREYAQFGAVNSTFRTYLNIDPVTAAVGAATLIAALVGVLWLWPEPSERDSVDASLILAGAVVVFLGLCLILQTPALRTTAFIIGPATLAVLVPAAALLARLLIRPVVAVVLAVLLVGSAIQYTTGPANRFVAREDWLDAGRYIASTFPDGTTVYAPRYALNMAGYLNRRDHLDGVEPLQDAFDRGQMVVVDNATTRVPLPIEQWLGVDQKAVEHDIPQERGRRPPGVLRVVFAVPHDPHITRATIDGRAAPALIDGNLGTAYTSPAGAGQPSAGTIDIKLPAGTVGRSLILASVKKRVPDVTAVRVVAPSGRTISLPSSDVSRSLQLVTISLGNQAISQVELVLASPGPRPFEVRDLWIYTP